MSDSERELNEATQLSEEADKAFESLLRNLDRLQKELKSKCEAFILPRVKGMLRQNLKTSGVKSKTGKLERALNNVTVNVIMGGKKPRIKIWMPGGISDYPKEDGGGVFYRAAASVNYGAVKSTKEDIRKKDKKALKKRVQKAKEGGTAIGGGFILEGGQKTEAGTMQFKQAGISVTKAFNFWELSASQKREIQSLVVSFFKDELEKGV